MGSWIQKRSPRTKNTTINDKTKLWDKLANKVSDNLAVSTIIYGRIEERINKIAKFRDAGRQHTILEPY